MSETRCDHGACLYAAWWTECKCSCGNEHEGHGAVTRARYEDGLAEVRERNAALFGTTDVVAQLKSRGMFQHNDDPFGLDS